MTPASNWHPPAPAKRRKAGQSGRQKGCMVYIPAVELARAGLPEGPWFYEISSIRKGSVFVKLYREP